MAEITVPVTVVRHTVIQEPVYLIQRNRRRSKASKLFTDTSSLASLTSYRGFLPSLLSYLTAQRRSSVGNFLSPFTALINSAPARCKLRNFSLANVAGFLRPMPDFLTSIILKVPMVDGRYLDFWKKRQGKNITQRSFSTPANPHPVIFVTC